MDYKPYTQHIAAMVDKLGEASVRAIYMIVKQVYDLEKPLEKE